MPALPTAAALEAWRQALPATEWAAVGAWASTFYPFQLQLLLAEDRFLAAKKPRQVGFTHTLAGWADLRAMLGETTTVVSIGEREAGEVLDKCVRHSQALVALGSTWARCESKSGELRFPTTGGRIIALPSSSGGRGYSGNVILDEFAYTGMNAPRIWDAASASVLHGYKMRVVSTPNGAAGEFFQLITDSKQNEGWRILEMTIHDAIRDGMPVDLAECWKQVRHDPRAFAQQFMGDFLNSDELYFTPEIVLPNVQADGDVGANHYELVGQLLFYRGIDIGLVNDLTAIITIGQDPRTNRCWLVDITTCKRTEWTRQQEVIAAVEAAYPARRWLVDETGLGKVPVELLQRTYGRSRVIGAIFTAPKKAEWAGGLYQAFADRMLTIPNDRALLSDLYQVRRIVTKAGTVKLDADHDANGHADRAWALALAVAAVNGGSSQLGVNDLRGSR